LVPEDHPSASAEHAEAERGAIRIVSRSSIYGKRQVREPTQPSVGWAKIKPLIQAGRLDKFPSGRRMTALLDDDLVFAMQSPSSGTVRERRFTPKINV
jgi:hypothetical protein